MVDSDKHELDLQNTLKAKLDFIRQTTRILTNTALPLQQRLQESLALILDQIHAQKGSIMMLTDGTDKLEIVAATREDLIGLTQEVNPESISGYVCQTRESLLMKDITKDSRFSARSKNYKTASFISVPLISVEDNRLIGVFNVSDHISNQPFTDDDLSLVEDYSSWVAPLLDNSCLLAAIKEEKNRYQDLAEEMALKQKELLITTTERAELVEMVVHDFKSPLAAIISNLDLLRYLGLEEEQEPIVETALQGGNKLLEMINDFLELARLDHWKNEDGRLKDVEIMPLVEDLIDEVSPVAKRKDITLEVLNSQDLIVLGDPMLCHHLMQNLLTNAVKYSEEGGHIKIGWEILQSRRREDLSNEVAKIFVEDTGIGVPDSLKTEIFEKFKRGNRQIDQQIQGSGIGLFICQKISTILKGKIWVEDNTPKGSRFCFTVFTKPETSSQDDRQE